jgi:hypothetical protein
LLTQSLNLAPPFISGFAPPLTVLDRHALSRGVHFVGYQHWWMDESASDSSCFAS